MRLAASFLKACCQNNYLDKKWGCYGKTWTSRCDQGQSSRLIEVYSIQALYIGGTWTVNCMDGQPTRPLVYAGSYTACCEGGGPWRGLPTMPLKKSENLRDICISLGLSIKTMHGPIQSRETVPLSWWLLLLLWYKSTSSAPGTPVIYALFAIVDALTIISKIFSVPLCLPYFLFYHWRI
jgi:hypothetical protein